MKRLLNYLPLHFVVLGILGICFQFFTQFWNFNFRETLFLLGFLTMLVFEINNRVLRTFVTFLLFFFIGVSSVFINDNRNYDSFYEHHLEENSTVILQIRTILKPGNYYNKYEANVIKIDGVKTTGIVLLNIKRDSVSTSLKVDNQILLKPILKELIPSLNPHQFDYKSYLAKQGIHHQLFTEKHQFLKLNSTTTTLFGLSAKFRNRIQESLKKYNFKNNELAVINALLLGQRQDISKELIRDYQRAGAVHILAVSGLHVGVILLILSFLFKPVEKLKYGKFIKTVIIVFLLWMFAFIAGLSASVVRAVTMFTFLAIGMSFRRKNVVEFSFISSMFFLLLIKPMFLFDVGFQLSYLAVFGILWTQPKIYAIWKPKSKVVDFFWQLFTVSIAAQIGILPLSIYYFQQFPGLFLASNLVIIPFLGAILIGGVLVMITSLLNILPQVLADFYGIIISWMNAFVSWISHQEEFLFKEISISFNAMICWYAFIFLGIYFLIDKTSKRLIYFFISIILIQSVFLLESNENKSKEEVIVFHKSRFSIIGKRTGEQLFLQHDLDSLKLLNENSIKSYSVAESVTEIQKMSFKNFIKFSDKDVLLIDSLGIYQVYGMNKPIVVLQYSPKINMTRLIEKIKPSIIIADGSNYKSYVLRWEKICLQNQIPFHYTGQKGAYILKN
ncbi:ComEC/Rec2 family competence protein [Polaribacter sp. SA4-12]|uniref:ComEC/Rec2 family competence protein n=1 Tax=Polaribacter sp. SA4-12 TaxID=1312072 RepID=UPI000B3C1F9F|nr:ComEC/Rec2 family competence protein [Polaribacter sp. SA4-12]ARV16203.1 competence protein [Polaribacter sp. SA4-12]